MIVEPSLPRSVYASKLREFPDIAFADQAAFQHRGNWSEFFGKRISTDFRSRIILEIGCFDAAYLAGIAAEHPDTAFVGIDWKCKAIYDGAKHVTEMGLGNVVLLRARGHDLLKIFADAELEEIWVFHPDPCDREAERNNRLISRQFLLDVHKVLKDRTSLLALKTDHPGYSQSVRNLFIPAKIDAVGLTPQPSQEGFHIAMESIDYWHDRLAQAHTKERNFSGKATFFESRFMRKNKPIHYIELRKK
jgi:tRNA G46 methylase TrmB